MTELCGGLVHPAWCAGRHDGAVHRSAWIAAGGGMVQATADSRWKIRLHWRGFPAAGPRLTAVERYLHDTAGCGR